MTDKELIHKVTEEQSQEAYAEIVRRYSGMVFAKALAIVRREELAAEVAQQTFVKAYDRLALCKGDALGPWLGAIVYHAAVDALNKEKRRRAQPIEQAVAVAESDYDAAREERLQKLENAIEALPDDDRRIIKMHYYEERSTKDIARETSLTQSNVLVRLHRIREKLKRLLSNDTDE